MSWAPALPDGFPKLASARCRKSSPEDCVTHRSWGWGKKNSPPSLATENDYPRMSAAAPTVNQDVKPQSDGGTPQANVSFYPQVATDSLLGVVKADGTTITIEDGVISGVPGALHNSDGPPATPAFVQAPSGGGDSLAFSSAVASDSLLVVAFKSEGAIGSITIVPLAHGRAHLRVLVAKLRVRAQNRYTNHHTAKTSKARLTHARLD